MPRDPALAADLFGAVPAPTPRPARPTRPAATQPAPAEVAPAEPAGPVWPDFQSKAWLRCPCGEFASYSYGTFPRAGMLGVRRCLACARTEGRL